MKINILAIGDIHWGALDAESLYDHLQLVLNTIVERKPNIVAILGDYFDYKLALNSKPAIYAIQWMNELIETCKRVGVEYIRVVKGTHEHDNNQLEAFRKYESDDNYFKIFNYNTIEELYGIKCMYCPDENLCNEDYEKKYMDNLSNKPDIAFFHGNFDIVMPSIAVEYYKNNKVSNIIFEYDIFTKIVNGPIIGGHWHITTINGPLLYTGSFDRWQFGEEEPKGFYMVEYDTESKEYSFEMIENIKAKKYIELTYTIDEVYPATYYSDIIERVVNNYNLSDIKVKITIYYSLEDDEDSSVIEYINSIKKYFINTNNVKVDVKDLVSKSKKKRNKKDIDKEMKSEDMEKYNFIFDKKLSIAEKIQNYILIKRGKSIPIDIIKGFINPYIEKKGE